MSSFLRRLKHIPKIPILILISLLSSAGILAIRHLGVLENAELWNYDQLIKLRSSSQADSRLLVVAIDEKTVKRIKTENISDRDLIKALRNLEQHKPAVIGVDILRNTPTGENRKEFLNYVNRVYTPLEGQLKPIIFTCSSPSLEQPQEVTPPNVIDLQSGVGFANMDTDQDTTVRRMPLSSIPANSKKKGKPQVNSKCQVFFSLGMLTAASYLQSKHIALEPTKEQFLKLGNVTFTPLPQQAGAYSNLDPTLNQIILDYQLRKPAEVISLSEVLDNKVAAEKIKDKVVLIGYTTSSQKDLHLTPFGNVPGIYIQAQVVQQVLATVLDKRPQVWFFPTVLEWLWIGGWGFLAGVCAWRFRQMWLFCLLEGIIIVFLLGTTYIFFLFQGWLPLVPSLMTVLGSLIGVRVILSKIPSDAAREVAIEEVQDMTLNATSIPTVIEPPLSVVKQKPDSIIGTELGDHKRYIIKRHLGGGGMGQVYLALDTRLAEKEVAIKILTINRNSTNQKLIARFQQEVTVMAQLKSPHIVKVTDFGMTAEYSFFALSPFYVMEYLEGRTLTDKLAKDKVIAVPEAINIVAQICTALEEAHQKDIAHRDLKPDNIFLEKVGLKEEIIKILDFGIAKIINDEKPSITLEGGFIGTCRYASPEQCKGDSNIDQRTDIYSLGIIFYEMLSNSNPFNIEKDQSTQGMWIASHIGSSPISLRSQPNCQDLPIQLENIIMKCLAKQPSERFQNINELQEALKSL